MTDLATIYVENPDIPAGTTIAEYRRSRRRRLSARATCITSPKGQPSDGLDDLSLA